jgi:cellulose biosynthesis protein BcsQ
MTAAPFPFLLADAAATWTDKEVLIALGSVAGTVISIALFALRALTGSARRRARQLHKQNQDLLEENQKLIDGGGANPRVITELQNKLDQALTDSDGLRIGLKKAEAQAADHKLEAQQHRSAAEKLESDLGTVRQDLQQHAEDLKAERRRIERALQKDGQTWTERVRADAPEFKPLDPDVRRTPIISVLNLKGGVGKTTITANLGAALDARGYRTLLLDLDLQGSLTGLFLKEMDQEALRARERLLGDFLASSFDAEFPSLLDYTCPILTQDGSALVPTVDEMAYAEMNLTIRWMLRDTRRDPRFLLRRELHLRRVTNAFDAVLMDCPPLINVSCVNALAASDYLLIPILPSKQATARVPVLLDRLKEFRAAINPSLKVIGVVCNRTHRSELSGDEETRLAQLKIKCRDVWGEDVPQFETFIRQNKEVRAAEDERRPLGAGDEMCAVFLELAQELEGRLPTFCRPSARAAAQGVVS